MFAKHSDAASIDIEALKSRKIHRAEYVKVAAGPKIYLSVDRSCEPSQRMQRRNDEGQNAPGVLQSHYVHAISSCSGR